jgi:hypothetical protein
MPTNPLMLASDDPLAVELTAALRQAEVERLDRLPAARSMAAIAGRPATWHRWRGAGSSLDPLALIRH